MSKKGNKYERTSLNSFEEWTIPFIYLRPPAIKIKEESWMALANSISGKKIAPHRSLNYLIYTVAACIILFISLNTWFFFESNIKIWCGPARIETVSLPDGSTVVLNAASTLKYNKHNWQKARLVEMNGEAFFHVTKGSQFNVVTTTGVISVLGTTFNVYARGNKLEVFCKTGKVAVSNVKTVILKSGMKVLSVDGSMLKIVNVEQPHEGSWQQGDFWFRSSPLKDVIAEIERQFDVTISYPNIDNRYYTGYFNRRSLNEALSTVLYPMQLNYQIKNKTIRIF
jgi:transmembrane sensor